jgi:hypothetical protein
MPRAYSNDLRERAVQAVEAGLRLPRHSRPGRAKHVKDTT